ncbi:MAG: glycoside hydrolase family 99-like domain-containing protein [Stackebrandtia sp.]
MVKRRRGRLAVLALAGAGLLALPVVHAFSDPDPGDGGQDAVEAADAAQRYAEEPMPLLELTAAGGKGRLYTLDQEEARKAVADNGMKLEAGRVAYMPREEFDGSKPMYRLKPSQDSKGWLFTGSADERDQLLADGWVDEGVGGHLYAEAGDGMVALKRFSNGEDWRLAPETRADEFLDAGYKDDGTLGYVYEDWIRAGAVYFGMFNINGHQRIIERTEEVYGREGDWWGGVRDFYDGHPNGSETWPGEDFSYLKPSIGYYDDSDPATIEKHIVQATSAGLSFFNFYWYWNSEKREETVTGAAMDAFLQAGNRNAIDFTVGVCAHPFDGLRIPSDQFGEVSSTLVDKYLSQENAMRTNDGRKILNICDARGIGEGEGDPAEIKSFVDTVRAEARDKLGEDVYVMINQGGFDPNDVPDAGADASYCTTDGPAIENGSYEDYLAGQTDFFDAAPGAYSRCVLSDFDERPRYPIEQTDSEKIRWFDDHTLEGFRQSAANVREDIDASTRPPEVDNIVYVYAWNEWHEGGAIEPNARDECAYLEILAEELRLQSDSECQLNPSLRGGVADGP